MVAEGFVGLLVGAEGGLVLVEKTVDFADLGGSGTGRMDGVDGAIDGS